MSDSTIKFQCQVESSDPAKALGLEILLDGRSAFCNLSISTAIDVEFDIEDAAGDHELTFVMSGKGAEDTTIDQAGNIVKDVVLSISNIKIDDIDVSQMIFDKSTYTHDSNGFGDTVAVKFFGSMGCNGQVVFKFSTPFYMYLLENV